MKTKLHLIRTAAVAGSLAFLVAGQAFGETSLVVNNVYWVDATGSPSENCTRLRAVLGGLPESEGTFLVKLPPGTYSCGAETVSVPAFTVVQGSGPRATTIEGSRDSNKFGVVLRYTRVQSSRTLAS